MEGEKITLNLTAAAEKVVLWRAMFPLREFFLPVNSCLSPWVSWGATISKPCPKPGLGQGGAEFMPVMHLAAAAISEKCPWRCQDLACLGETRARREASQSTVRRGWQGKARQGKAREELKRQRRQWRGRQGMVPREGQHSSHSIPPATGVK